MQGAVRGFVGLYCEVDLPPADFIARHELLRTLESLRRSIMKLAEMKNPLATISVLLLLLSVAAGCVVKDSPAPSC